MPVVRWEYKAIHTPYPEALARSLNRLGNEGWELCGMLNGKRLIFKRPLREDRVAEGKLGEDEST